MANGKSWPTQWTILASEGAGGKFVPEGSQFSLEPQSATGTPGFYRMHVVKGMHPSFEGRLFYPMGVKDIDARQLPKWNAADPVVRRTYMSAAEAVKRTGRADPLAARLEGTFTVGNTSSVARIYHFPNTRADGRHWSVFDIAAPTSGSATTASAPGSLEPADDPGDGTGHSDGG
jgi:hypothetical protein